MKSNKTQTTILKCSTDENVYEISSEELGKIHRKYHPMETNNSSYKVDDEYMKRFEKIFGTKVK